MDSFFRISDLAALAGRAPRLSIGHAELRIPLLDRLLSGGRTLRRLVVNVQNDKLSFRRRLLKSAQVLEYRLEIIANAAKIAETI